jgi:hypothetical protein
VVWRPRVGNELADQSAGQAAVGQEVNLKGVTVVGERSYGAQRFALVILNAKDERTYLSADRLGKSGPLAARMASTLTGATSIFKPEQAAPLVSDMIRRSQPSGVFDWEHAYLGQKRLS